MFLLDRPRLMMMIPRGVLLGILGGGVPPGYPNPDPTLDQKSVIVHTLFIRPRL